MRRYYVEAINRNFDRLLFFETDNPKTAINKWIAYNKKYPACVAIFCKSKKDCIAIYSEFCRNGYSDYKNKIEDRSKRFYYDFHYLYEGSKYMLNRNGNFGFCGNSDYYDQVPYFSFG